MVRDKLIREDTTRLWSTKDLLGGDERGIMVFHHFLNHFTFKTFIMLSKRSIIPKDIRKVIKLPPCED